MSEVLDLVLSAIISWTCIFGVVIWDERRMAKRDDPRLERAWPPASRASAIVGFGEIALLVHFIRTRRSLVGVAIAIGWTCAVVAVESFVGTILGYFLGDS